MAELAAAAPVGLPLSILCLVMSAALLVMTPGSARRTAQRTLVGWSAILVTLHTYWLAPMFVGTVPRPSPGPTLTVLAQNFEYGQVASLLITAGTGGVGVIVLTDVGSDQQALLRTPAVTTAYPYSVGTDPRGPGETIVLSRYPLSGDVAVFDDHRARLVEVATPFGQVNLIAAHPSPPDNIAQWRQDYRWLDTFVESRSGSQPHIPTIVAGDLNATQGHVPFRRLVGLGLRDATEETNGGLQPTWPADNSKRLLGLPVPPLIQIDHVLVGGGLVAISARRVVVNGSDHLGVLVVMQRR